MTKYMTRQRRLLLEYLGAHHDETLTAQQIADDLSGANVSLSAVYRNLAELEAQGKVRREAGETAREASYRYLAAEECRGCLHLSCKKCGRTFHMDSEGAQALLEAVARTEDFAVDEGETVLYGVCGTCKKQGGAP